MRNISIGKIIKLKDIIEIKKNQTISKRLDDDKNTKMILFGLYNGTDISEELYEEDTFYLLINGLVEIGNLKLDEYSILMVNRDQSFSIRALEDSVLLEISFESEEETVKNISKGEVIKLANLVDYVDGGISNIDIVSRPDLKMMVMAFDAGEGLSPHTPPGDALVIPLEGEARLTVGDETFEIKSGEQLVFPKGKVHAVEALTKYKMLLILVK